MQIVKPSFQIEDVNNVIGNIERAARTCYKSEEKIGPDTADPMIERLISNGHEAMIEFGQIMVRFVFDRGVSHEMVRHRLCAFAQESTRYCNYGKGKFGEEITVVDPFFFDPLEDRISIRIPEVCQEPEVNFAECVSISQSSGEILMNAFDVWLISCLWSEWGYLTLLNEFGRSPQEARSVLPNSLKTEICVSANAREWRHILRMRADKTAHPQMREVMIPLGHQLAELYPALFGEWSNE